MISICSWCGAHMGGGGEADPGALVSHGICPRCAFHFNAELGMPLREFLDGLDAPVVVMDDDARVRLANERALALLGKSVEAITGELGGDVFECRYARLPEGCGRTQHCVGCTVRRAVTATYETGIAVERQPAHVDRGTGDAPSVMRFLISTTKGRDVVFLRMDEVNGEPTGAETPQGGRR
jgi:PAS domain-containing protein